MSVPSIKIPRITNADKAGLVLDPGTFVFNNDTNSLEFVNQSSNFIKVPGDGNEISHQIWVNALNGNDSNSGGIDAPFASYDAARLYAKTIATSTNLVLIQIIGNQNITGNFVISPYIVVNGNTSGIITATGDIRLDTDFLSISNSITRIINCSLSGTSVNLTWGAGDSNYLIFDSCSFVGVPILSQTSPNTNAIGNGILLFNISESISSSFGTSFTITNSFLSCFNSQISCQPTIIADGAVSIFASFIQCDNYGQITADGTGSSGGITLFLKRSGSVGLTINSTNVQVVTDSDSLSSDNINFSGGSTIAQFTFISESEPLTVSSSLYTPANYTPNSPSSKIAVSSPVSHLKGIDDALVNIPTASSPLSSTKGGTGVSNPSTHTIPVAQGSSDFNFLGPLSNGQLLIGRGASLDPLPATLTESGGVVVTNAAGSITLSSSSNSCAFGARASSTQSNVTGDGTIYTIQFTNELFDKGNNFDGTSTFTAPNTGLYLFNVSLLVNNLSASHTSMVVSIITTLNTYEVFACNAGAVRDSGNNIICNGFAFVNMTAGNTCIAQIKVFSGTKTVNLASTSADTYFCGFQVC